MASTPGTTGSPVSLKASWLPKERRLPLVTLRTLDPDSVQQALRRHATGDWGDLSQEDCQENDLSAREGFRILSAYTDTKGTKFWIITEADRSATAVQLPKDY